MGSRKPFHKLCPICKEYLHPSKYKKGAKVCKSCKNKIKAVKAHNLKREAVEYLGGECFVCGLKTDIMDVYEFHHINPKSKIENISKMLKNSQSLASIKVELKKCKVLCCLCHRIIHYNERNK